MLLTYLVFSTFSWNLVFCHLLCPHLPTLSFISRPEGMYLTLAPGKEVCFPLLPRQEVERGILGLQDALAKGGQKPEWMRWSTSISVYFYFTPFQTNSKLLLPITWLTNTFSFRPQGLFRSPDKRINELE